jgi:RNA polymerase primary sigma factor
VDYQAKWFRRFLPQTAYPSFEDIRQEGRMGLIEAAGRYDPSKGKFAAFATWRIRAYILRLLREHRQIVRVPSHCSGWFKQLDADRERRAHALCKSVSDTEVLRADCRYPRCLLDSRVSTVYIEDHPVDQPVEVEHYDYDLDLLPGLLERLQYREREILKMRYALRYQCGLRFGKEMTLEQIGKQFRVTRECVRQIENRGMRKIKWHLDKIHDEEARRERKH